jgi:hypothetical protein
MRLHNMFARLCWVYHSNAAKLSKLIIIKLQWSAESLARGCKFMQV